MGIPINYAVVMGDLVGSEIVHSTEQLHISFNAAIDRVNRSSNQQLASPLTITLGDEFQGLVTSLRKALPIVRAVRFDLLKDGIDCRFAIGVVELRSPLNRQRAWNMMGPGLSRTRAKLEEKRAGSLYRFAIGEDQVMETVLDALGTGLTSIERRWTAQQRQDIIARLAGATTQEIASHRNVSIHSVYKVRAAGDFDAYTVQWHAIGEMLAQIDNLHGMS